jgi:aminoglycoside phosphotransferase (APT) family kinase protein
MHLNEKVQNHLIGRFGPESRLLGMDRLGQGTHGVAYRLRFSTSHGEKSLIMKTLFPSGFGHDHFSDRAQVLLLAQANYNEMPRHIRAVEVVGESPQGFVSLKDVDEFYLLLEEAEGAPYFRDLTAVLKRGHTVHEDFRRVEVLARFLAELHRTKYTGSDSSVLYRRRIRELIGHGECIMGIIDTFDRVPFVSEGELIEYASACLCWWGKIRNRSDRLSVVHGDYHPGNIWFQGDEVTLLDRSRGTWGEPADDVACLSVNYIHYALKDKGAFEGPFSDLFRVFLETYLEETQDEDMVEVLQPFFAFRILVLANPKFYPDDTRNTKRALLDFGHAVLHAEKFKTEDIPSYLGKP